MCRSETCCQTPAVGSVALYYLRADYRDMHGKKFVINHYAIQQTERKSWRSGGGGGEGESANRPRNPIKKNHRSAANRPNTADIISSKQIIERRSVSKADQTRSVIDVFSTKWCCVFLLPSFFIALLFLLKCHERLSKFER